MAIMKQTRTRAAKIDKLLHIKIYTTPEIIRAFADYSRQQGRSSSRQGEFLVKQALALDARERKLVANGDC